MSGWQAQALCAQVDPELWFPEKGGSSVAARRICQRCPVRTECLGEAMAHGQEYGVWGGLTEMQRRHGSQPRPERQAVSAREHVRLITSLSAEDAARELDVSARTVHRWRRALQEAS